MNKRIIFALTMAFVVAVTCAAYAEVQNVKVSGELNMNGVGRNNFDLAKDPTGGSLVNTSTFQDKQSDLFSITKVRIDADLTDNVSTTVRFLNERNWGGTAGQNNKNIGLNNASTGESNVSLALAYVRLKEFLYSPLSLTVGLQPLRFNNGWIVGDPDTNIYSASAQLAEGDLSSRKAFDSVRATLDYNPLVMDVIYAKIAENNAALNDDTTLTGVNASYELDKMTTMEGFFYSKLRGSNAAEVSRVDTTLRLTNAAVVAPFTGTTVQTIKEATDSVHTVGARVVNKTINNLTVDVQAAYQFGTYNPKFDPNARYISATEKAEVSPRSAWGTEFFATYDLKDVSLISKYQPTLTGAFVYLSGESRDKTGNKTYHGWDAMCEDQTLGHIMNAILGFSNAKLVGLMAKVKPMDDVSVSLDYTTGWFNKRYPEGRNAILSGASTARQFRMGKSPFIGNEFDLTLAYDYTEDVKFSLLGGIFLPGKSINEVGDAPVGGTSATTGHRAAATELIGSMKVTF